MRTRERWSDQWLWSSTTSSGYGPGRSTFRRGCVSPHPALVASERLPGRIPVSTLSACRRTRLPPLPAEDGVGYGSTAAGRLRPPARARRLAELPKATFERGRYRRSALAAARCPSAPHSPSASRWRRCRFAALRGSPDGPAACTARSVGYGLGGPPGSPAGGVGSEVWSRARSGPTRAMDLPVEPALRGSCSASARRDGAGDMGGAAVAGGLPQLVVRVINRRFAMSTGRKHEGRKRPT